MKKESWESRKIDIFPKGLTHGFGIKMAIFRTLFFRQNRLEISLFYDILEQIKAFLGYENKKLKKSKIDIFPKGSTHDFGIKMAILRTFFF